MAEAFRGGALSSGAFGLQALQPLVEFLDADFFAFVDVFLPEDQPSLRLCRADQPGFGARLEEFGEV